MAIQTLNTIKKWFKTGLKPSQDQFWDTWDSFRHKYEKVPIKDIEELETTLDTKAEKSQLDDHKNDQIAHAGLFSGKEDKYQKGVAGGYVPLDEFSKITHQYLNLINNLTAGGENSILSAEQGVVLQNQIDNINRLLKCDNVDLDTVQKIVDAVTQIQTSIDTILVNDLTTGGITKALTAEMGKILELNKEDKSQKGLANGYAPLDEFSKIAHQYLSIVNNLTAGGATASLSAEQGVVLQSQIDDILTVLSSDNINLDTIQEIVDAIETVQVSLSSILVNDLTTGGVTKALTAEMGKTLDLNKEDKSQKGLANGYAPLDSLTKLASQYLYIVNDLITGGATSILSAEQGKLLQNQINGINTLLSSDNIDLDTIQEIVDAIENVESYLSTILVNDLKTGGVAKALTAEMGKQLDQIKLTATLATDAETQTTVSVAEDNKVVSRSKLFNWWESMKSQAQTIKAVWNFSQGILIPNGVLTTVPQNGAIERDSNGLLWETHNGIRSKLITSADGLILLAYKSLSTIQTDITGAISAIYEKTSSLSVIGSIRYVSVLRLNATNETYFLNTSPLVGSIEPTIAKTEVFLKINNGLFATDYTGRGAINQVKIMEFSGLKNNGLKNYQNTILTDMHTSNPLTAQWSTIRFVVQSIVDGVVSNSDALYYLRDDANSRTFSASEASFSFAFKNTITYADATNALGENKRKVIRNNNYALYIETIK